MTTLDNDVAMYAIDRSCLSQNFPSKAHSPKTSNQRQLVVSKEVTYSVRRVPITKAFNTVRFLLSKVCFEGKLSDTESMVLYHYYSECNQFKDRSWQLSKSFHLNRMKFLIDCYQRILKLNPGNISGSFWNIAKGYKYREFLHSSRAYFGRKEFFNVKKFLVKNNRRLRKPPPPQRFIGVGYGDYGTCRKPEIDSSPSWQDVASSDLYRQVETKKLTAPELATISCFGQRFFDIDDIGIDQ